MVVCREITYDDKMERKIGKSSETGLNRVLFGSRITKHVPSFAHPAARFSEWTFFSSNRLIKKSLFPTKLVRVYHLITRVTFVEVIFRPLQNISLRKKFLSLRIISHANISLILNSVSDFNFIYQSSQCCSF